jgi:MoxR-like ATPase
MPRDDDPTMLADENRWVPPTQLFSRKDAILSTATTEEIDIAELEDLRSAHDRIRQQIASQIVGQDEVVEQLLMAVFARGHCILEGVPGLAKTLMVHSLAQSLSLEFNRIQFTPDLMPSDITGTEVLYEDRSSGVRELRFVPGPIFANLILADEINRTPPKTQAALLEAMQERQVTAGGRRHPLPEPFFVLATQNPIEQEGTYPLPEAQLDRFLFKIFITYPTPDEERRIYKLTTGADHREIVPTLSGDRIADLQRLVRRVPVSDHCIDYAMELVRATRGPQHGGPSYISEYVTWGAGPRAGQSLILAAKARAALAGRPSVSVDDIRAIAPPVLRHRIVINYNAQAAGESSDSIIKRLLNDVPVRKGAADAAVAQVFRS